MMLFPKPRTAVGAIVCLTCATAVPALAGTLGWTLPPFEAQLLSDGNTPIPAGTVFQLGVFAGSFVPDAGNQAAWATHWRAADFEFYDAVFSAVDGFHEVEANAPPFTAGKRMYVWGIHLNADGSSEQWLGTADDWLVPSADPLAFPVQIDIDDATTLLRGSANPAAGTIQMAAVGAGSPLPVLYGDSWLDHYFDAAEMADPDFGGWLADPDSDGRSNALEFAMGTDPLESESTGSMKIEVHSGGFILSCPGWASAAVNVGMEESSTLQTPWLPLAEKPVFRPELFRWELEVQATGPRNFYRTMVEIPEMP